MLGWGSETLQLLETVTIHKMEASVTVSYLQYQQASVITKQENKQTNVNNKYVLNVNLYLK